MSKAKDIAEQFYSIANESVKELTHHYDLKFKGPHTHASDLTQIVYLRLSEWLSSPKNQATAEELLKDYTDTIRWMKVFTRRKILDEVDVWYLPKRNLRKTIYAGAGDGKSSDRENADYTFWDRVGPRTPASNALSEVMEKLPNSFSRKLLATLISPPKELQLVLWKDISSSYRTVTGSCTLQTRKTDSLLTLKNKDKIVNEVDLDWQWNSMKDACAVHTSLGLATVQVDKSKITYTFPTAMTAVLDIQEEPVWIGSYTQKQATSRKTLNNAALCSYFNKPAITIVRAVETLKDSLRAY